jgi:hypothetical protein
MKRFLLLAVLLVGLGVTATPTFASLEHPQVPVRGIEGPDISAKVDPRGTEGPDVRRCAVAPQVRCADVPDIR